MEARLKEKFILLEGGEEKHSDILYHIESSVFYRLYKEPTKQNFRKYFSENEESEDVNKILGEIETENAGRKCGCKTCGGFIETNPENFVISKLALVLTSKCNLRCKYCYANYGMYDYTEENMMSEKVLIEGLEYLSQNYKEIKSIQFFGGEPSLCVNLIRKTIAFFKQAVEKGKIESEPVYGIVTNGVFMSKELMELYVDNNFFITISLDGPEVINNKLRIDSKGEGKYQQIKTHYKQLIKMGARNIGIECTYTAEHIKDGITLVDLVEFFDKEFNCAIPHIVPVSIDSKHELSILREMETYKKYLNELISYTFDKMIEEKKSASIAIIMGLIGRILTHSGQQTICPAGVQTFSLSHDKNISPCFMYTSNNNVSYGKIGDCAKSILQKAYAFDRKINNKQVSPDCSKCIARAVCSSCLGSFEINDGKAHVSDAIFCETIKHSTLAILSNIGLIKSNKEKWEKLCEFLGEQSNETKQKK